MAYTPPGVEVQQLIETTTVTVQSADQDPVLAGECFEVFEARPHSTRYSPLPDAGAQVFAWPGKKATSIVDLSGVRKAIAEPDAALMGAASFKLKVQLQDPVTLEIFETDPLTDIDAVGQTSFRLAEGIAGIEAKAEGTTATSASPGRIRSADGGFVAANVKVGDLVQATLPNTGPPTTVSGVVTSMTDAEIVYETDDAAIADGNVLNGKGNAVTTSGKIIDATGGFNAALNEGDRVALFPEALEVDDGNATGVSVVTSQSLQLVAADLGRKVTIGSARIADGAVTGSNGAITSGNSLAGTGITAGMVGRVLRLSGGTPTLAATYRRILTAGSGTCTFSGAPLANTTAAAFVVYASILRNVSEIVSATEFGYDGASLADVAQTALPVILHSRIERDISDVDDDTTFTYSGQAIQAGTGNLTVVPYEVFRADVEFSIFPSLNVLVTYRALDVTLGLGVMVSTAEELALLGDTGLGNPLLFAAKQALAAMGTVDRNLMVVGINPWQHMDTPSGYPEDKDELAAYLVAIAVLDSEQSAYYLVPQTKSPAVRAALVAHINSASLPQNKMERSVHVATTLPMGRVDSTTGRIEPGLDGGNKLLRDSGKNFITEGQVQPGAKVVITAPAALAGTYLTGVNSDNDELELQGANWSLTSTMQVTDGDFNATPGRVSTATANAWKDAKVGDWIISSGQYRRVSQRLSSGLLAYDGGVLSGVAQTVAIIQSSDVSYYAVPLTKDEQAEALYNLGQGLANRRVVVYWPDEIELITGLDSAGLPVKTFVSSTVLASMAAGQYAVLPVQNSTTGHPMPGVTSLKHSNKYFDRDQLNRIAEGGVTIYEQPVRNGPVKCRDLRTTKTTSVKESQFSYTKNVDNQAKVLRTSLEPFLNDENGRKNISQALLDSLMLPVQGIFDFFVAEGQLVSGANGEKPYTVISITQHPTMQNRIVVKVRGNVPLSADVLVIEYVI